MLKIDKFNVSWLLYKVGILGQWKWQKWLSSQKIVLKIFGSNPTATCQK